MVTYSAKCNHVLQLEHRMLHREMQVNLFHPQHLVTFRYIMEAENMERNSFLVNVGYRIGKIRSANNETQKDLQEYLQVNNRVSVTQWENGQRQIDLKHLKDIAEHYNVSADWLLGILPESVTSVRGKARTVYEYTGLSEKATQHLHKFKDFHDTQALKLISDLLEDNRLQQLLLVIEQAKQADKGKTEDELTEEERKLFNDMRTVANNHPSFKVSLASAARDDLIDRAAAIARRMIEDMVKR